MRRVFIPLIAALALTFALAMTARAQDVATLVADRVSVTGNSLLTAEGGVEVLYQGRRLKAQAIIYDRTTDRLRITGPILLSDGAGSFVLADQADLAADLTEGILTSARLVLNERLQIAAAEMFRVSGRYTQLSNTVASSCQVCAENPVPLWEIRADRVIHDQEERQLYFDHAQLRVAGLPVFYIPRLRMPDPTLNRATGFLMPRLRTTSGLGTGFKIPYFWAIDDQRDLLITPYLTTKNGRTVELRYRQAFRSGSVELSGSVSRDDLRPGETRGYALATGLFEMPRDYILTFRAEAVSDPAYMLDYGISQKDRLDSRIEIARTRRNEHISARVIQFRSIRAGESNATLPSLVGDFTFHRRFSGGPLGGEGGLRFQLHSHARTSADPLDRDADGIADGRDTSRASIRLDWRRNWILPGGIIGSVMGEGTADFYDIRQDAAFAGSIDRLDGAMAVELRWPWVAADARGVSHVIEPIAQLVYASQSAPAIPNEDSTLVEFDEGNLLSLNRFSGNDARERGGRLNLGLGWTRLAPAGWSMGVHLARSFRTDNPGQFGPASGLDGKRSDWLASMHVDMADGLRMTNRLVFDDGLDMTKAELRMDMIRDRYGLSSSYLWRLADPLENRPTGTSELTVDGSWRFTDNWSGRVAGRYDFIADRATSAGLGLEFKNECLKVDLSLSRRFTSSTSVKPTTDFGLGIDLLGIGGGVPGTARACRR
ncbi:LPS-assembly protein LptD [Aliigemmobacter aestuarii]|uniref:LPS-assembly protein LptD n=1 Tax=Aliigemmobacter aestuarii TaxID=1445661 RepID=A0A4S3ML85_9RHOB|nr:LPS assembly protein LptD [Gemmobacter aestuarii]THD82964.1 LPS-assembly protein LptD [Gemmobacter aestuarii]